jgi:hypothetical protein
VLLSKVELRSLRTQRSDTQVDFRKIANDQFCLFDLGSRRIPSLKFGASQAVAPATGATADSLKSAAETLLLQLGDGAVVLGL